MYKVVIVDDDLMIRTQIKTDYFLEEAGYYVAGEAVNGEDGLEVVARTNPDIVITDMSMPNMDGVHFIGRLCGEYPDIVVIVISSYDDFDYVSKSLKMKAADYLLKHTLNREILMDALKKCADTIDSRRRLRAETQKTAEQAVFGGQMLRRAFLLDLLGGKAGTPEEIKRKIGELAPNLKPYNLKLIVMELDNMNTIEEHNSTVEISSLMRTAESILQESVGRLASGYIMHVYKGRFVVLLSYGSNPSRLFIMDSVSRVIEAMRTGLKKYMNFTATYIVGGTCESLSELPGRYRQACEMGRQRFYLKNDSVITQEIMKRKKETFLTLDPKYEHQIADAVGMGDLEACMEIIAKIYQNIADNCASRPSCQIISVELIHLLKRHARGLPEELFEFDRDGDIKSGILAGGTLRDMRGLVERVYKKAFETLRKNMDLLNYQEYTIRTIEFIRKNYRNNIGLSDAAEQLGLNKSYLSRMFAADCGVGFTEYLNQYRVEKAKHLIRMGGEKIKSVSEKVGFNNNTYFFKVFKELTGMTPQEYEKSPDLQP